MIVNFCTHSTSVNSYKYKAATFREKKKKPYTEKQLKRKYIYTTIEKVAAAGKKNRGLPAIGEKYTNAQKV